MKMNLRPLRLVKLALAAVLSVALALAATWQIAPQVLVGVRNQGRFIPVARRVLLPNAQVRTIVQAAKAQIGTRYDASFKLIAYPMGDVSKGRGAYGRCLEGARRVHRCHRALAACGWN